jgi:hypothetical protein
MTTGRTTAAVIGAIVGLIGAMLLIAGGAMLWALTTERDADGYFTSPALELTTQGHAITTGSLDLASGAQPGDWVPRPGDLATRIVVTTAPERAVFVGVAAEDDIERYLAGVAHAQVATVQEGGRSVTYRTFAGTSQPPLPAEQDFWAASTQGAGRQVLEWDVEQGRWGLVVMNAEASAGVATTATAAFRAGLLTPLGGGLAIGGLVLLAIATALIVAAFAGTATRTPEAVEAPAAAGPYPLRLEGRLDTELSRWQWLVKWLLLIPHFVVLAFLLVAFVVLTVVAGVAILFTGRYPRRIFDFNAGVLRWTWRVGYYSYSALGTDRYPPFTLAATDYPAALDIAYPASLSRGLVLVKWWLLAIPHYLIVGVLSGSLLSWSVDVTSEGRGEWVLGGGLIGILVLIAAVILTFTGRYPHGLFDLIMGLNRWVYRVAAYAALMTDEYPPFRLDTGGAEPSPVEPAPTRDPTAFAANQDRS